MKTGVERHSFELLRAMRASLPPDAEVVLYSRVPLPPELGPFDDRWRNRVLRWPLKYFWTQLRLSWEMLRRPPDVLFVPGHLLPRIIPKRTVATIHDASFVNFPQFYPARARAILITGLKDVCRRATTIIAPSKFTAEQLAPFRLTNISVISHGVSIPQRGTTQRGAGAPLPPSSSRGAGAPLPRQPGRAKEPGLRDTPYFVVLGRVEKKKNPEVVIDAFAKFATSHPDFRLIFIGLMAFESGDILKKIKDSGVADRIEFTGPLPDEQMYRIVKNAAALLHPCPLEGFGLPVIEAMSLGTPVITANAGAVAEAAGDAALLISPIEADKWREAMDQITFDIFRQPLIEKGRVRAAGFTWERAAEATWKVLLGVLE